MTKDPSPTTKSDPWRSPDGIDDSTINDGPALPQSDLQKGINPGSDGIQSALFRGGQRGIAQPSLRTDTRPGSCLAGSGGDFAELGQGEADVGRGVRVEQRGLGGVGVRESGLQARERREDMAQVALVRERGQRVLRGREQCRNGVGMLRERDRTRHSAWRLVGAVVRWSVWGRAGEEARISRVSSLEMVLEWESGWFRCVSPRGVFLGGGVCVWPFFFLFFFAAFFFVVFL